MMLLQCSVDVPPLEEGSGKATCCWGQRTALEIYPAFWKLPQSFVVL